MDEKIRERIEAWLSEREQQGLERAARPFSSAGSLLNLANNDYFRMANNPQVREAATNAIQEYGCSSSASPLVTGFTSAHAHLKEQLLEWHAFEYGMLWNSGYAANHAILSTLPKNGDWILADRLSHNSMLAGALRSSGRLIRYPHNDRERLEQLLKEASEKERSVFVVTESVFSMDGDLAALRRLSDLKKKYGFFWMLDEAHALSWYGEAGEGLASEMGVDGEVDLLLGTLGKGLGSMGAYTLFHDEMLQRYLENACGEYIYSTFFSPSAAAAASKAIEVLAADSSAAKRLAARELSRKFRELLNERGIAVEEGDSPVVPVIVGEAKEVMEVQRRCEKAGYKVGAIRPPTVPKGTSRLRISLHAGLSLADLEPLVEAIGDQ